MKNVFKKIAAIVAVATMSIGTCALPVSANEFDENGDVPVYDIAPELDLTDEDVESIIEKTRIIGAEEGLSEDEIERLVDIWYYHDSEEVGLYSTNVSNTNNVKQFFTTVSVQSGQIINNELSIRLEYGLSYNNIPFIVDGYNLYNDCINTSVGSVSNYYLNVNNMDYYVRESLVELSNLGIQPTVYGNIMKFNISNVRDNNGTVLTGKDAYMRIANNSCIRVQDDVMNHNRYADYNLIQCNMPINYDVESTEHYINYNVGGYGDVAWYNNQNVNECGKITSYDAQYVLLYVIGNQNLNPVQKIAADVDFDNNITSNDALKILNYVNGNITYF